MKERNVVLREYVSDMLAVERHILRAVERQTRDDRVRAYRDVYQLLMRIESTLSDHALALEQSLSSMDGEATTATGTESFLKKIAASTMGAVTGLYDRVRSDEPVSRNLRDDYTALNLAAVSYSMLHTTGLAFHESRVAELAFKHLTELTPLVVELSKIIPSVVTRELAKEGASIDDAIAQEAVANTQKAWSHEVVH